MLVVEIGMKINRPLIYYHDMLVDNGLRLDFACVTHDVYYTNKNLNGLSEGQMKDSCVRLRSCSVINGKPEDSAKNSTKEHELIENDYTKIFDTIKFDFQYSNGQMLSKVQLQDIKDIGLLVYYDNPDYYGFPLIEQRNMLIDELNSYGFDFRHDDLGLDKLRTFYYGREMFSENQAN